MGRSVSSPSGAYVAYCETPYDPPLCLTCDMQVEDGQCMCEGPEDQCWTDPYEVDWDWVIDDLRRRAMEMFPSLWPEDDWIGREDHVLARNNLVDFGVSEYCGLMAVWLRPRTDTYDDVEALAENWISLVWPRFSATFGTLHRIGVFSNGEALYRRIGA